MSTSNRVMITDDALFMRVTLKNLLINSGYDVVAEAVNGKDAVERYKALKPDVVFMDITMPEMDGIAATRAIKESDPNARVIMCTAMGQKHLVIEAIQAGAKDFIVKPFSPERVLESIEKVIG
jgi:two-component system chemotaxis response regulator CheY